ncbi:MAG: DNA primase [Campylobacterales bacterium]|nr:DNA primase [Campylobacterales bacterium]
MIAQSSIDTLRSSLDIVDVIGNSIELKKSGANYKANCPFHGEKTPSFVVSPSKQIYHCFGCGAGGDALKFVMEFEKLTYPEAIEKLASTYNFVLEYTHGGGDYNELKRVLEATQKWYVKNLDLNEEAKSYLKNRGISARSIEEFEVGFVGHSQSVMSFLQSQMLPLPKAQEAGIVATNESGKIYARLVERITFPIYSSNGNLIGFGGRTLGNHPAKYINSPQTKLFNKSSILYGYHRAKKYIYEKKQIIITEGYLDVIMFHQAGFKQTVATLGTALTSEHLPLLKKGEPKVILAYDGDKAGVEAAYKASLMLASRFDGGVVLFGGGLDPADMIAQGKTQEVSTMLRSPKPFIAFVLEEMIARFDLRNALEKQKAFDETQQYLNSLSEIIKESYTPLAASLLGVSTQLFKSSSTHQHPTSPSHQKLAKQDDIMELSIIKTLLERRYLVNELIEFLTAKLFKTHFALLHHLLQENFEHPPLTGLLLDDTIQILSSEELKQSIIRLQFKACEEQLSRISQSASMDYKTKNFHIQKLKRDIMPRLKQGELVAYESHITI